MSTDHDDKSDDIAIARCLELLTDDYNRQGNFLSFDDVTRVVLRRRIPPEKAAILLERLKDNGIHVAEAAVPNACNLQGESNQPTPEYRPLSVRSVTAHYARHDLLSHDEEIKLGRRYQAARSLDGYESAEDSEQRRQIIEAGTVARTRLVLSNIRLVIHFAKQHAEMTSIPLDDLIQEGIIGLFRAVEKWEPDRGFRFSTYASWWISQCISRAIADRGRMIRVPVHVIDRISALRKKRRKLLAATGRDPSEEELARELGWSLVDVFFILRIQQDAQSLDDSTNDDTRWRLHERMARANDSPTANAEKRELSSVIGQVLDTLDKRSRKILVMRFGLRGGKPRTLEQVGRKFGITRERIRQIEKKALQKIASTYRAKSLKPYLPEEDNA